MVSQTCNHCGANVADDEQFCPNCGSFIDPMAPPAPDRVWRSYFGQVDGNYEEFSLGC